MPQVLRAARAAAKPCVRCVVAEFVKCTCEECGAKYRLPVEYRGRTAKCKKCGAKFKIPAEKTLEDSVLDWLTEADADAERHEQEEVQKPRIVSMSDSSSARADDSKSKGPIRLKSPTNAAKEK